jgi:hypothetical protein
MPINVACSACGKQLRVNDLLAGKHIKCPGCQATVAIPAAGNAEPPAGPALEEVAPAPPARKKAKKSEWPDDDYRAEDFDYDARKRRKAVKAGLFSVLITGAVVAVLLCGGGGVLLYFFVIKPSPERILIGKWQVDVEASKQLYDEREQKKLQDNLDWKALTIEFKSDGTLETVERGSTETLRWEKVESKGDTVTINLVSNNPYAKGSTEMESRWTITIKNKNQILLAPADAKTTPVFKGLVLKRQ